MKLLLNLNILVIFCMIASCSPKADLPSQLELSVEGFKDDYSFELLIEDKELISKISKLKLFKTQGSPHPDLEYVIMFNKKDVYMTKGGDIVNAKLKDSESQYFKLNLLPLLEKNKQ